MRVITKVVYTFAELSDAAKEKAIETIREKLGGEWWDSHDIEDIGDVILHSLAQELGTPNAEQFGCGDYPGIPAVTVIGWDAEGGGSLVLDGYLDRDNAPKLPWTPGILGIALTSRRSDHSSIHVECTDLEDDGFLPASQVECDVIEQATRNVISAALKAGQDEVEYKTGEEYAKDWVENNDHHEYSQDGTLN